MNGAVRVELTGPLRIHAPGGTVAAPWRGRRHAVVVFARLVLAAGQPVTRDELADVAWGDELPPTWAAALRNAIAAIRALLDQAGLDGAAVLRAHGDGYRLDLPAGSTADVIALEEEVAAAEADARRGRHARALRRANDALAIAARPVLSGAEGEWVDAVRDRVARLADSLRRTAAESALALGEHGRGERLARELIEADPLREDGWRLLMRALHAAGNTGAALSAYDDCRRLLSGELGTDPDDATQGVFLEILREQVDAPDADAPRRAVPGMLLLVQQQTPFVGRGPLLASLADRLRAARNGVPAIIAVGGEPGLGKTRLAAELAAMAHERGHAVLYGRADDRMTLAHRPFLEALDSHFATFPPAEAALALGRFAPVLSRLLPSLAGAMTPGRPTGLPDVEQQHVAEALAHALRVAADERGALVILDDMQWAGATSAGVLEELLAGRSAALLVLALHRGPDLPAALPATHGREAVELLELEPLTVEDVAELARLAGVAEPEEVAASVWRRSGGNPLLASELLRTGGPAVASASPRVAELVAGRVAALPAAARDVLGVAAAAGLEFDPRLVAAAATVDPASAAEALAAARRAALLVPAIEHPEWLAFRHALVRESLLDALEPTERMRAHRRLGAVLEDRASDSASLAYHFGAAAPLGDWRSAVRYGLPAARAAFAAGVYEDVVAMASRTLSALSAAGDPDPPARLDLEILLGGAQRALGDHRGHATLEAASAAARALGDAERLADAALSITHGGATADETYVDGLALPVYEEALAALGDRDPQRRAQLLGHVAAGTAWSVSGPAARVASREALALARSHGDKVTLSRVLTLVRRSLSGGGDLDECERLEQELLELADEFDDAGGRARAAIWRFGTRMELGRGEELERWLDLAAANIRGLRMGTYHHSLAYSRAALALLRGEIDEADALVEHAAATGREHGLADEVVEAIRLTQLMGVRHEQGRLGDLRDELVAFFSAAGLPEWRAPIAFVDAELGRLDTVGDDLDAFFAAYGAAGGPRILTPFGLAAHLAAPVARLGEPERAEALYELLLPWSGLGAHFAYFAGPVDHALGLLAEALGRGQTARMHMTAAAAFAERVGAPLWADRCQAAAAAAA